jgi:hypothetical protein
MALAGCRHRTMSSAPEFMTLSIGWQALGTFDGDNNVKIFSVL